jgi:hypothetical protein
VISRRKTGIAHGYDAEVEYLPLTGTRVESGGYRGHEGVRTYFAEARELWDVMEPEGHNFKDSGEYVLVAGTMPRPRATEWRGEQSALRLGGPRARRDDRLAQDLHDLRGGAARRASGLG